ncbi:MAG TPA: TonB family protein [Candidatus Goldiibacteriota bacterium]|nr:TonB family protein [Candidatus Goldiibacteriota bacterium]
MNKDKIDLTSFIISIVLHLSILFILSKSIIQTKPRYVALITDVTLMDFDYKMGEKGEEKKSMGLEKKQDTKIATVLKKQEAKKTSDVSDTKILLKKIEDEKAKLNIGISRDKLRSFSKNETEEIRDDQAEAVIEEGAVAGGEPTITGSLATRKYKKIEWRFPENLPEETELMIEITVLSSGIIKDVRLLRTSGYPELDRMAISQARKLQFEPLTFSNEDQVGALLFKFGVKK